jgi:hypothetical protein
MAGLLSTSVLSSDLNGMIADLYVSVTGNQVSGTASASLTDFQFASELEVGGEVYNISQSVIMGATDFSASPIVGDTLTIDGTARMIARWSLSSDGVSYTIDIADNETA